MPTFLALQCFKCNMMQVKQEKKSSNKWNCTLCNEKQSVRKVYASSMAAKDVRKFVQDFNFSRNSAKDHALVELAEQMEEGNAGHCYDYDDTESGFNTEHNSHEVHKFANKHSKWEEYLPSQDDKLPLEVLEDSCMDGHFVTTIPDKFGRKLKRKNQEANTCFVNKTHKTGPTKSSIIIDDGGNQKENIQKPKLTKMESFTAISNRFQKRGIAVQENTGISDVKSNNQPASKWSAFLDSVPDQNSLKSEDEKPGKWFGYVTSLSGKTSDIIDKFVKRPPESHAQSLIPTKEAIRTLDSRKTMADHKHFNIQEEHSVSKWAEYMEPEESEQTVHKEDDNVFTKWRSINLKSAADMQGSPNIWALKAASSSECLDGLVRTEVEDEPSYSELKEEVHQLFS